MVAIALNVTVIVIAIGQVAWLFQRVTGCWLEYASEYAPNYVNHVHHANYAHRDFDYGYEYANGNVCDACVVAVDAG